MKSLVVFVSFFFFVNSVFSQKINYTITSISDSLSQNANAVVRLNKLDIIISSQKKMTIVKKRIISVFNEKGLEAIEASENYDKTTNVNSISATIFSASGEELKKIRRKEFRDICAIDGATLFSDNRIIYLNYTPTSYPFTIEYNVEISTSNTAFIPQWFPLSDYYVSVENSILNVNYPENLGFKKKELNFGNYNIKKTLENNLQISYIASGFVALKPEDFSPAYYNILPYVMMGLEHFNLEGVDGNAKTWKEFGQWYYDKILSDTAELSEVTISKIKALTANEKDVEKKIQIVYNFLQQKSRYVSIQVGIGGWKPMKANDVDRLGYGDCKALSNYTKALLKAIDIPSYNTILYGNYSKRNIQSDFVSMQGNHMILCVPNGSKYIWLECTSQDNPFGYQANFTDDRDVVIIKPDGGEVVRTQNYQDVTNALHSTGSYSITDSGDISATVSMVSEGSQYGQKEIIEKLQPTQKEAHYKEYWNNISNLKINKESFVNDKLKIAFTEKLDFSAEGYGKIAGNNLIFAINALNQFDGNAKRIRNRKTSFEILRGFIDTDEVVVALPANCSIDFLPQSVEINNKFGSYKTEVIKKDNYNLVYKRSFLLKKGNYPKNDYEDFRQFLDQVSRNDNAKVILIKK